MLEHVSENLKLYVEGREKLFRSTQKLRTDLNSFVKQLTRAEAMRKRNEGIDDIRRYREKGE